MKRSIKNMLSQSHEKQTKSELIHLLSTFAELIGEEEYKKVNGIEPKTELDKLTKKEIIAILNDFNQHYNAIWETNLSNTTNEIIKGIFGQIEADEAHFSVMGAGDANFAVELGNIDFENLIGGPMQAAIKAQNSASLATVSFINEVGFDTTRDSEGNVTSRELIMSDFSHTRSVLNPKYDSTKDSLHTGTDADGEKQYIDEYISVKLPFIALLNTPSLRIETLDIDFNVKLNSTYTKKVSNELGINASFELDYKIVKFKVSGSYKRTSSIGTKIEKEYSMNVKVKATNDEMPAGLEKVLGLLSA